MGLKHVPVAVVALVGITVCFTFYLSYVKYEHVTYVVPYISDTGAFAPESCYFGQGLNMAAALVAFIIYIKYLQVQDVLKKHHIEENYNVNMIALYTGETSALGLSFVGNFQETNLFTIHMTAAHVLFGAGALYICQMSYLYVKISPVIGQRKLTMIRIILSIVSLICFLLFSIFMWVGLSKFEGEDFTKWRRQDGGWTLHQISSIGEWTCATCIMVYIMLFYEEFGNLQVMGLRVEEKGGAWMS